MGVEETEGAAPSTPADAAQVGTREWNESTGEWEAHMRLFVKELRTTELPQGHHKLFDGEGYCCLGIACELAIREGVPMERLWYAGERRYVDPTGQTRGSAILLPELAARWLLGNGNAENVYVKAPPAVYARIVSSPRFDHSPVDERLALEGRAMAVSWLNDTIGLSFADIAECFEFTFLRGDWELNNAAGA